MAEYKDIEQILNSLPDDLPYKASVKRVLIQAPVADVVPKSEVIQAILSLIDDKIRYEVEICNGFISARHSKTLYQERINALNDIKLIIKHQYYQKI